MTFEDHRLAIAAAVNAYNGTVKQAKIDGYTASATLSGDGASIYSVNIAGSVQTNPAHATPPKPLPKG